MEANGNICVATIGECGISVVSPEGELVEFVATDDIFTTNIALGGADMRDAYLTLSGSGRLVTTCWARPGLPLQYCEGTTGMHRETHAVQRIGWLRAAISGAKAGIVSTARLIAGAEA